MKQYFFIVSHLGGSLPDKVSLQEQEAIKFGRAFATKHPDYIVYLSKQEITKTGKPKVVTTLTAYNK